MMLMQLSGLGFLAPKPGQREPDSRNTIQLQYPLRKVHHSLCTESTTPSDTQMKNRRRLRRLWTNPKVLAFLVILLGLFGLHQLTHSYFSLDQIIEKEDWLRGVIQSNPATAIMVGFAVYCVTSLVPGASGKSILFGWLFGFWWATLIGNVGLTVAALSTFFVSRFFLRNFIERKFANQLAWLNRAISADGGYYLVLCACCTYPTRF